MEIDESTMVGNIEVIEEIMRVLEVKMDDPDYAKYLQLTAGDQLLVAHQHAILQAHLRHESCPRSWRHIVPVTGLFHAKIADCHGVLKTHLSKSNYAKQIFTTYADADRVQELRERRIADDRKCDADIKAAKKAKSTEPSTAHIPKGHMVLKNAILFMRDALLTREFSDAIKIGDSGQVVLVLWAWTFCYRGSGRSKYAHEMLHLMHNLMCVWTKELRYIVLQNWLANPQGKFNCFVELDLMQEHLNFWIKKIYKADGVGHSWEWLSLISPCVDILRQLATKINNDIADIDTLITSLTEHKVYVEKEGRVLDADDKPVPDVLSVGMAALTHGGSTTPLSEFNEQFDILRERRRLRPVSDLLDLINTLGADICAASLPSALPINMDDAPSDIEDADDGAEDTESPESTKPVQDAPMLLVVNSEDEEDEEEDIFAESPTLTCFDEGDVEFDMDEVPEWSLDEVDDSSESEDDDGEM
ncbi:hypothetical protein B0H14DRAFT_3493636 [Mycena olivaceomarginata]|nr:hypothetical protein B0H14DRAFT_3493636 [Mycena olivaceomarginata]